MLQTYILCLVQLFLLISMSAYLIQERFSLLSIKRNSYILLFSVIITIIFVQIGVYAQIIIFLIIFMYNLSLTREWSENLLCASLSCSSLILIDHFISFLLFYGRAGGSQSVGSEMYSIASLSIRYGLYFVLAAIVVIILKKIKNKVLTDKSSLWIATAFSLGLYLVLYFLILSTSLEGNKLNSVLLNSFFISVYFVFTLMLLLIVFFYMKKRSEDKYKEIERQNIKEYTSYLETNYNELRKFRHDYQNILMSLESFIEEDNFEGLKQYYYNSIRSTQRLIEKNDFKLSEISRLEITEVKSIVVSKLLKAQQLGIDAELEMKETIDHINMDSIALIRCVGIILDNAIEETVDMKDSFIRMAIIKGENEVMIVVQNAIKSEHPQLFEMKKEGFSTKGEKRGVGLNSLQEMISKQANATLETLIDQNTFIQKIEILS